MKIEDFCCPNNSRLKYFYECNLQCVNKNLKNSKILVKERNNQAFNIDNFSEDRIKIEKEDLEKIREIFKSSIPISRIRDIVANYKENDKFFIFINQLYEDNKNEKEICISIESLRGKIINWSQFIYSGSTISKKEFFKLQLLIGNLSIPYEIVPCKKPFKKIEIIRDKINAEFCGFFLVKGIISSHNCGIYFSYNLNDDKNYILYIKDLIKSIFKRTPSIQRKTASKTDTRRRFWIGGKAVIDYLVSQDLQNERIPHWIKKSESWIREHQNEWKEEILPLVIACLRGMINGGGWIGLSHNRIEIHFTKTNKSIVEDFAYLCNILDIRTGSINKSIREKKNWNDVYYVDISSIDSVKRFLIDLIRPLKWDIVKLDIQSKLAEENLSIEDVLEMNSELKDIRRRLYEHQKLKFTFQYNFARIKEIKNPILRDNYYAYIDDITFKLFPENEFEIGVNLRPSRLKFVGEHKKDENGVTVYREVVKTDFIRKFLVNNNPHIKIYYYKNLVNGFYKDLLDIVRRVFSNFREKKLGRPCHDPILKEIMISLPNALATEIPVWKKLQEDYCVGHIDLNLINGDTFFVADFKDNDIDIIKSLPQIMVYGINQRRLIFKDVDYKINFKCLAFSKDEIWEFDPKLLKKDIIKFIKYANSLRSQNLKSLAFPQEAERTDLLEDIEKSIAFLSSFHE